ncbi:MAG: sucrase ferredoxin [Mycobacteriales bacterium]
MSVPSRQPGGAPDDGAHPPDAGGLRAGAAVTGPAGGRAGIADRCAASAQRRGDARHGTAAPVPRWFLVEQPGGWGVDAVLESGLDRKVGAALLVRARPGGARVVLIRRPGRQVPDGPRRWAVVDSRAGHERVGWGRWDRPEQLLDIPLDEPVGDPGGPVYLVCAHGRHDPCCAIRGRPVAEALAAARPDGVWECSHVGGDRFAANLVALPHGLYYGHVPAEAVTRLAAAYEAGEVDPLLLRGRSAFAQPAQAAQHYARLALGETHLDALRPVGMARLGDGLWRVRLLAPGGGPLLVTVRAGLGPPVRLTCSSRTAEPPRTWQLVALRRADGG